MADEEHEDFDKPEHVVEDSEEESSSGSETESDSEIEEDTGLTDNQNRLLYLISLYEGWLRKQALLVLIYEGVVAQVLDYDYAPASDLVENRRKYFNISQEGKSDVDFLREEELISGLKLSSKSYNPVTCFQASEKGKEICKRLSRKEKEAVHEFVYAPGTRELLYATWDGEVYWLMTKSESYKQQSTVTDTEDVSYVSSAYVPQCLRQFGRPTLSNAHRAHECGATESNIRDQLDEVITLNSVSVIVSEFIPFGANQIVQLNSNLGSTERVQGGFYTALVDEGNSLDVAPGLTSVNILDYSATRHINFEADIHFANEGGASIVQVETFGVSMNAAGTCFYGMQVEAVMDRIKDNISLDHLARLLVDVHQDSSQIVDSVISSYQRRLLNLIFMGDAANRDKVNLLIANEITPHLTADEYMDKGEYENELKQVLGDTRAAFDISENDTLIFGAHGVLIAGPNSRHHEPLLCAYLQFISMDIFVKNFFSRLFIISDDMQTTSIIIEESHADPNALHRIRHRLQVISKDIILMGEILGFLKEALAQIPVPSQPPEQAGRSLYARLDIEQLSQQIHLRVGDLAKNLSGLREDLQVLRDMSAVVTESRNFALNDALNNNTRNLCLLQEANERSSAALELALMVLAGSLAFDVLDRITGEWTVVNEAWMSSFVDQMINGTPALWFFFNLLIWGLVAWVLRWVYRRVNYRAQGNITLRIKAMRKVHNAKLFQFIASKHVSTEDRTYDHASETVTVVYEERRAEDWGGCQPSIALEFDERNSFLHEITLTYNKRAAKKNKALDAEMLKLHLMDQLDLADIWDDKAMDVSDQALAAERKPKAVDGAADVAAADP